MKKLIVALSVLASANAFAVHNGNPDGNIYGNQAGDDFHAVNPSDWPMIVEDGCTGTVVAGRFVISAGHCTLTTGTTNRNPINATADSIDHGNYWKSAGSQEYFSTISKEGDWTGYMELYSNYTHEHTVKDFVKFDIWYLPEGSYTLDWKDLSISYTDKPVKMDKIIFLADLSKQPNFSANEKVKSFGSHCGEGDFELTDTTALSKGLLPSDPQKISCNDKVDDQHGFAYAEREISKTLYGNTQIETKESKSYMVDGDSGGPVLNEKGELIATNIGGGESDSRGDFYTLLYGYSSEILKINRWHYPTVAKVVEGEMHETVIQSLRDPLKDQVALSNTIKVTGDVSMPTLDADCTNTKPYAKCTIHYTSNGGVGRIILADDQYIDINPKAKPLFIDNRVKSNAKTTAVTTNAAQSSSDGGTSGAGIGIYALLALLSLALVRMKKITLL